MIPVFCGERKLRREYASSSSSTSHPPPPRRSVYRRFFFIDTLLHLPGESFRDWRSESFTDPIHGGGRPIPGWRVGGWFSLKKMFPTPASEQKGCNAWNAADRIFPLPKFFVLIHRIAVVRIISRPSHMKFNLLPLGNAQWKLISALKLQTTQLQLA